MEYVNYFIEINLFFPSLPNFSLLNGSGDYWADITTAAMFPLLCWDYNGSISVSDNCVQFIMCIWQRMSFI